MYVKTLSKTNKNILHNVERKNQLSFQTRFSKKLTNMKEAIG